MRGWALKVFLAEEKATEIEGARWVREIALEVLEA